MHIILRTPKPFEQSTLGNYRNTFRVSTGRHWGYGDEVLCGIIDDVGVLEDSRATTVAIISMMADYDIWMDEEEEKSAG